MFRKTNGPSSILNLTSFELLMMSMQIAEIKSHEERYNSRSLLILYEGPVPSYIRVWSMMMIDGVELEV